MVVIEQNLVLECERNKAPFIIPSKNITKSYSAQIRFSELYGRLTVRGTLNSASREIFFLGKGKLKLRSSDGHQYYSAP
jgi:hypothetical protein